MPTRISGVSSDRSSQMRCARTGARRAIDEAVRPRSSTSYAGGRGHASARISSRASRCNHAPVGPDARRPCGHYAAGRGPSSLVAARRRHHLANPAQSAAHPGPDHPRTRRLRDRPLRDQRPAHRRHQGHRAKVICYFSAGTYEDWRPDRKRFPPRVIVHELDDWPGERYVGVRSASVRRIMLRRLDLAVKKGCDAVDRP